jgi:EmrB/QacA subfamily drug resistance transporter
MNTPDSIYQRKWKIMMAVGVGIFLATIDSSIVNIALPTLVESFQTKFALVQWVVLSYLLTLATLLLSIGRLADIVGKKPIYLSGMITFIIGSLLCGLSPTIHSLILFRILQAIGAAMMISLGAGIITESFPASERGKSMGVVGSIVSIGIITGPTLGGLIIEYISWHWIFFVNLPVGLFGSILVYRFLPDIKTNRKQRFDFPGAITLFISLLSFLLALTLGQNLGFFHSYIIFLYVLWLIFFLLFLYIEFRIDQPMVDMKLFKNKLFSLNLFTGFIIFVSVGGTIILMPFFLQYVLKFDPKEIGLLLATVPISAGTVSPFAGTLSDRFGTRRVSTLGLLVTLAGFISLLSLNTATTPIHYIISFLPIGIGLGIFQSPNNSAIMSASPPEKLGVTSGLLSLTRTLGQTSGIAAIGSFWFSRVAANSAGGSQTELTESAPAALVSGLHETLYLILLLLLVSLILNSAALYQQEKRKIQDKRAED